MLELKSLPVGCADRRQNNACGRCGARPLSVCGSIDDTDLGRLDALAEHVALAPGQALIREGDEAKQVFNIT